MSGAPAMSDAPTMNGEPTLSRAELERLPRELLSRPSPFKASTWRVETPAGTRIVKDARHLGAATRWIARWLLARELRVLERVAGLERVPGLLGSIDRDAIALTFTPGKPLDAESFRERPRELAEQLLAVIEAMHARGVFHLDLHQRKNLLIDEAGRLCILDFGAALAPPRLVRFLVGWYLRWVDRHAAVKFLARFAPHVLTAEEARSVLRYGVLRRFWPFTTHRQEGERAARKRLEALRSADLALEEARPHEDLEGSYGRLALDAHGKRTLRVDPDRDAPV